MADLRLTEQAIRDLDDIQTRGIEQFGPRVATRFMAGFGRIFSLLRDQPRTGQARPEFRDQTRGVSHRPYREHCRVVGNTVVVVRILHQARDLTSVPDDDL